MSLLAPRVILVRRETDLDRIRASYTSAAAARFVLERKGLTLEAAMAEARQLEARRQEAGVDQAALDAVARQGLANAPFEDHEEEGAAVLEEFYPETQPAAPAANSRALPAGPRLDRSRGGLGPQLTRHGAAKPAHTAPDHNHTPPN